MEKRRGHITFRMGFGNVTIRVGNMDSIGQTAVPPTNTLCGVVGNGNNDPNVRLSCGQPVCGRYVTLEKKGDRFELAELFVNGCGLGAC